MRTLLMVGLVVGSACVCHEPVRECTPTTCAAQGKNCGTISDGCDHLLDCGTCTGTSLCGGGGPNVCGEAPCRPTTCSRLGAECGLVADGCASVVDCGGCAAPLVCGAPGQANRCVPSDSTCTPKTCASLGAACGTHSDGCGLEVDCGACLSPAICTPTGRCVCSGPGCERNEWSTIQSDSAHTGFNSIEDGLPPLSLRWTVPDLLNTGQVVTDGQLAFTVATGQLHAIDVGDGGHLWSQTFNDAQVGQPAFFGGRVYLATAARGPGFWAIEPVSGHRLFSVTINAQWDWFWAPIQVGGVIVTNGGITGGVYGFDATSGARLFFHDLAQVDEWSPATDGASIFSCLRGRFEAFDLTTGATWTLTLVPDLGFELESTPTVADGLVFVAAGDLFAIDIATRSVSAVSR